MSAKSQVVGQVKDTSGLMRARFSPGALLRDDDLNAISTYTRELSRLMFRTLFGCGVLCGLKVNATFDCDKLSIVVDAGVGLDCHGDPIEVPRPVTIVVDPKCLQGTLPDTLWVTLCPYTKCCAPRTAMCPSDDENESTSVCMRERDGFDIQVRTERPPCVCGCPEPDPEASPPECNKECRCVDPGLPCYEAHYNGECGCNCADCSDCDCECILLARLHDTSGKGDWSVDHRVRRFVRPVLMCDPLVPSKGSVLLAAGTGAKPNAQKDTAVKKVKGKG
jgi:hypothetical protein